MPYVMVPVPEEHVEEVMRFMLRALARASEEEWDLEAMTAIFDGSDEITRTLLSVVARATLGDKQVSDRDVAEATQLSVRESTAIIRELNELAREENRPNVLVRNPTTERLPNGRLTEKIVVAMEPEIAELIAEAERADLAANPLPGTTA